MIKRIIAGALSAAICTSASGSAASACVLKTRSDADGADTALILDVIVQAEEGKAFTTAPATAAATKAAATTKAAAATTAPASTKAASSTTAKAAASTTKAATTATVTTAVTTTEAIEDETEPAGAIKLGENISAVISTDGTVLIRGFGSMDDFNSSPFAGLNIKKAVFEDKAKDKVITSIGANLFNGCAALSSVGGKDNTIIIPDGITTIGDGAFSGCSAVKSITIGSGVETIGRFAFSGLTGVTKLTIPGNVKAMGRTMLGGCTGITELTLPYAGVSEDCTSAEGDLNPDHSVTDLFYDDHWDWDNDTFDSTAFKLSKIIITGGERVPAYAFSNLKGVKEIDLSGTSAAAIGEYAFAGCTGLTDIKLPATIKSIGSRAFLNCSGVKDFGIKEGLETLADFVFENCTGLTAFEFPDSLVSTGRSVLQGCTEITKLTVPYAAVAASCAKEGGDVNPDCSVTDLFYDEHWNWANEASDFKDYKLSKITVKGGTVIPAYAFAGMTGVKEIDLSKTSVTSINNYAFYNCTSLVTVKLPETLTAIGDYSYSKTPITALPDNGKIRTVGEGAFADCKKLEITTVPDSYETIGRFAFRGCTGIKNLTIPATVTSMGRSMLMGCTELTELTLPYAATDAVCCTADGDVSPDQSVTDLFYDEHWNTPNDGVDFSGYKLTKLTITGGEKIPDYAFSHMDSVTEIDLSGSNINSICSHTFNNCKGLTVLKFPGTLKSIGTAAFLNCTGMEVFDLPDRLETIGSSAFQGCTGIRSLVIPDSVTSMGRAMLMKCNALETLTLPYAATDATAAKAGGELNPDRSVTDLFYDEHWNWANEGSDFSSYCISKIIITGGERIPENAFSNMTGLREVNISGPDISTIDSNAFRNCTSLEYAEIPVSVVSVAANAFNGIEPDIYVYGKETGFADKALSEEYSGTVHGYKGSSSNTYADENSFEFQPVDGETVIGPKVISMAVGDSYSIKTGADKAAFKSSDENIAKVSDKGIITAIAPGETNIEVSEADGKTASVTVTVRKPVILCTPGDVNRDGNIDAVDASAVLTYYANISTDQPTDLDENAKAAADVNGDGMIDSVDASSILSYYAYTSTTPKEEIIPIGDFLKESK